MRLAVGARVDREIPLERARLVGQGATGEQRERTEALHAVCVRGHAVDVPHALLPGQTIALNPGDGISIDHDAPPSWRWHALS